MPLFMDLHINPSGDILIEELIQKHKTDLAAQEKYGVEFKSMWVNKEKGMVFCLMEGPDQYACTQVHQEAHGDAGCHIIEVSPGDYHKFLAGSLANQDDIAEIESGQMDTGYRTILQFEMVGPVHKKMYKFKTIERFIHKHHGTLLIDPHPSMKAVFVSSANALGCAGQVKRYMDRNFTDIDYRIAVISGKPVDQNHDQFYGYASDLSEKLSKSGCKGSISSIQLTCELLYKEKGMGHSSLNDVHFLSLKDEAFLYQLLTCIEDHYTNPDFNTANLVSLLGLSRAQLFRKVKQLTGHTPNTLIREVRLYEALQQIHRQPEEIAQIAYNTGFNSPSYFSKLFKQRFNTLPSDYIDALHD